MIYAPVLYKLRKRNNVFVERNFKEGGEITVTKANKVKPYDSLGNGLQSGTSAKQSKKGFELLSGVWGEVQDVIEGNSVLLKTQVVDINLFLSTDISVAGELLVFPNPSKQLTQFYLDKFSKSNEGKIIYVGEYLDEILLDKAKQLKVSALICGSTSLQTYLIAKANKIAVGIITGFGELSTPAFVYDFLNTVSNRFVFFEGEKGFLRIPAEAPFTPKSIKPTPIKALKKGAAVQIFKEPNTGKIGIVDTVKQTSILVRVDEQEPFEVELPNLFILE